MNVMAMPATTVFLLVFVVSADVQTPNEPEGQPSASNEFSVTLDAETRVEVDSLIPMLGAPRYAERERATIRLMAIGPGALRKVRDAYLATDDPEVHLRVEAIVENAYLSYHVYSHNGFLGISHRGFVITHEENPQIPEGRIGVMVERIIPGTAADRSDLQRMDLIVAVDGVELKSGPNLTDGAREFGEKIRLAGPGSHITLTVLRDESKLEVGVIIGARNQRSYYGGFNPTTGRPDDAAQMFLDASRRFPAWWRRYFARPSGDHRGK